MSKYLKSKMTTKNSKRSEEKLKNCPNSIDHLYSALQLKDSYSSYQDIESFVVPRYADQIWSEIEKWKKYLMYAKANVKLTDPEFAPLYMKEDRGHVMIGKEAIKILEYHLKAIGPQK